MNRAVLLLGGNMGNRIELMDYALVYIAKLGTITSKSSIYESEAWGFESEKDFLNIAITIETEYNAFELLKELQIIEQLTGRERSGKGYSSRKMDIDILFYNDEIIETADLQIPHPRLHKRMFTLKCLMDIIPNYTHPKLKMNIIELTSNCTDNVKVWLKQ